MYLNKIFNKMNDIYYDPPLYPLRVRGVSGIHFIKYFVQDNTFCTMKNQKLNSAIPLHRRGAGVGKFPIYLFSDFSTLFINTD